MFLNESKKILRRRTCCIWVKIIFVQLLDFEYVIVIQLVLANCELLTLSVVCHFLEDGRKTNCQQSITAQVKYNDNDVWQMKLQH